MLQRGALCDDLVGALIAQAELFVDRYESHAVADAGWPEEEVTREALPVTNEEAIRNLAAGVRR